MKFATSEWAEAYVEALNKNTDYKEAASWWEGDFIFEIEPSGNLDHGIKMYIGLYHGDCTGARILKEGEDVKTEFVFSGIYDNWVKVLKQELDPIQGLMAGKFKLVGNMAKVMRATKAAQELVVSTTKIDTEFY
ncbi:MAG: SCP2 sterol-binding domain-containing protein [Promethearchaeota archaeon]